MNNQQEALNRYIELLAEAAEAAELITAYLADHGEVAPDDVNWGHVGSMAELKRQLNETAEWIGLKVSA